MKLKNIKYFGIFFVSLTINANTDDTQIQTRDSFIEVGLGETFSNNPYKTYSNTVNGFSTTADIEFDYIRQDNTNTIDLNYTAEYSKESEEELQDGIEWKGQAAISQQIFTRNLIFNLQHQHLGYLIDRSLANTSTNNNDKDLLQAGLRWVIPYSLQASFILSATHTETWYEGSGGPSDESSNEAQIDWQYILNNKAQFQLNSSASGSKFDDYDTTYNEYSIGATYTQQYLLGSYSLSLGETWTDGLNESYSGYYYSLFADALYKRHLFTLNASRELTNSSSNFENEETITFNSNSLYWYSYVSLDHQYDLYKNKLFSTVRLYFERNDELTSIEDTTNFQSVIDKYGVSGQLTWKITDELSSTLTASYYESDLSDYSLKRFFDSELSAKYRFSNAFYVQLIAAFEKQGSTDQNAGYQEQSYTARLAYRY